MLRYCYACSTTHEKAKRCPQQRAWGGRSWVALRDRVLTRDGHVCQECGGYATHCDHIVSRAMGGSDDPSNLRALCSDCNLAKGNS